MVRGSMPEMRSGTILGREGIEERGGNVPNLRYARILHACANPVETVRRGSFELIEGLAFCPTGITSGSLRSRTPSSTPRPNRWPA
jgi:hypothetical protein